MIYLNSFTLSDKRVKNPNLYPYSVFSKKEIFPFYFAPITMFYGNNGCGKSTLLSLIAQKIGAKGVDIYAYGQTYIDKFLSECTYGMADNDYGYPVKMPDIRRYIKSEDILYEIKKIQQEEVLKSGYVYELAHNRGLDIESAKRTLDSSNGKKQLEIIKFAQEKYSNGETAMQLLIDALEPDAIYLLDEPEVSLSPQNQVKLAEEINRHARLLHCQFLIATHSPFMLGTLHGKIFNLDSESMEETDWTQLENVRYFYEFFKKNKEKFLEEI